MSLFLIQLQQPTASSSSNPGLPVQDIQPQLVHFIPVLTLEGLSVARDEVLELKAVGANILKSFPFNSKLVALLHLPGTAGWTLMLTHQEVHIWVNKGELES